jgi:ABC-2 type transport system permease protein
MTRVYWLEVKYEFWKVARQRAYTLFMVLFPLAFYLMFGVAMHLPTRPGAPPLGQTLLPIMGGFGVIATTLFGFGVGIAVERGLGWLELKRASPVPMPAYFFGKTVVCLIFAGLSVLLLLTASVVLGGVRMPFLQWPVLWIALVLGATPFCALGFVLGSIAGPNSAPGIINAVYLPMCFCSGYWAPLDMLPKFVQVIAPGMPAYHLAQIASAVLKMPTRGSVLLHVGALACFGLIFAALAVMLHVRERAKMYG